jgi:hypothetical protein
VSSFKIVIDGKSTTELVSKNHLLGPIKLRSYMSTRLRGCSGVKTMWHAR